MIVREPIPHWNNFTVPELKEILEHCEALERLGIAQDEEMMLSIERDIVLREKKIGAHQPNSGKNRTKINIKQQPKKQLLTQNA